MKMNNFRGDLTDISARNEALVSNTPSSSVHSANSNAPSGGCHINVAFTLLSVPWQRWMSIADKRCVCFSKLNKMFFGYFDPENIFLDNTNE